MATGARAVQSAFHRYERDRLAFANAIGDAARAEGNTALLTSLGAPRLLLPLLSDSADGIACASACALGRLAGHSATVANTLAQAGVVKTLVRAEPG